ncbi:hypothetical protein DBV05_g9854 [Lasiodiplodia theobromae]|uniref:Uncharacterized protein n=1 Tax=Lasiodiplodia theobromae TaxID=45133 RepID=A0A5N5D1F7_9PEZI|nr:hypothetical protein DBV05_g9854 [Lasiodiplodia theobromae]
MASQLAAMVLVVTLLHFVFLFLSLYHLSIAPLLSLGDAISSFLQRPDPSTRTIPFSHLLDALQNRHHPWTHDPNPPSPPPPPPRHRKLTATTPSRRLAFAFLLTAILGLTTAGLALGITRVQRRDPSRNPFATGIGASVNIDTLMPIAGSSTTVGPSATIWRATLLANAGQPLLSLLHCAYNALFTALYLGTEWDGYGGGRGGIGGVGAKMGGGGGGGGREGGKKGLRISSVPRGAQRASHFLQLPWRYGVPLSAASTLLHWLASQSVFTVSLVDGGDAGEAGARDDSGKETATAEQSDRFFGCGFSPLAMALLLVALLALLACLLAAALPRFKTGMPVVGSCSAAIAAACRPHPRREEAVAVSCASPPSCKGLSDSATDCPEEDISALPLSWGVVEEGAADQGGGGGGEVRFCALTSDDEAVVEPWMRPVSFAAWRERALEALGERNLAGGGNGGRGLGGA